MDLVPVQLQLEQPYMGFGVVWGTSAMDFSVSLQKLELPGR